MKKLSNQINHPYEEVRRYKQNTDINEKFLVHVYAIIVSWTFIDIHKDVCSVEKLFEDIKDGEFPHVKRHKKACLNLTVTGCNTK